ncbi:MAG: DUF1064 domain-containing protein [Paludibacteraceae bacterium]|nr:DUF1064 domain-containing protein [Paludibacteraceae bacterium]
MASKYRSRSVEVDGIRFDSKKEASYYKIYKMQLDSGQIKSLELQPKYELIPRHRRRGKAVRSMNYYADFEIEHLDGRIEIIDVKASASYKTEVYRMKKKIFEYLYPDKEIVEVY